jgi:hypothetical protein
MTLFRVRVTLFARRVTLRVTPRPSGWPMWTLSQLHPPASWPRPLVSEYALADAWEQRAYTAHYLVDCCGHHLRVVFPGRRWGGPGPDFVGAVLAYRDGTLVRGDVEVHPRASSWAAHGHARDPAYRGVVLHVVQRADVVTSDGRGGHLPTVEIEPGPGRCPPSWPPIARAPCVREAGTLLRVVEEAGRERFRSRAARFEGDLSTVEPDQTVWRGVAEALGFRRNARPFGQLADAVPWSVAAAVVVDRGPVGLAGLLLGTAGLLAEASLPEAHAWRALQRSAGVRAALRPSSWDRRQLRAGNAPAQRCRGLAELAARWTGCAAVPAGFRPRGDQTDCAPYGRACAPGPAEQVVAAVRQAAGRRRPSLGQLTRASPWIGPGRAQVVAINVLLPFAAAAGVAEAGSLFERLPGEPSNRVVRYMAEQLRAPALRFRGACHQQGLLHLFALTCAARRCESCPAWAGALFELDLSEDPSMLLAPGQRTQAQQPDPANV